MPAQPASAAPAGPGWRLRSSVVAAAVTIAAAAAEAQDTGTLRGTVTLVETGGLIDGAIILILGTGAFTFTDDGTFEITGVPAGLYEVTAQREHLTTARRSVAVTAGGTTSVEFALRLSPIREDVTVTAPGDGGGLGVCAAGNYDHHMLRKRRGLTATYCVRSDLKPFWGADS